MQSQAIFFYLNKVTRTYTFTPHLLGSEYLYIEFFSNNLTPVCLLPARNANDTHILSSNTVYLGLQESEARTIPKLECLIPQVSTQTRQECLRRVVSIYALQDKAWDQKERRKSLGRVPSSPSLKAVTT